LACEMVIWSPSQTGGFPPGTPVSTYTKTIRTQTSVPTSMINISCITCFVMFIMKEHALILKEKTLRFSTLPAATINLFMTNPLNIILDDFGI